MKKNYKVLVVNDGLNYRAMPVTSENIIGLCWMYAHAKSHSIILYANDGKWKDGRYLNATPLKKAKWNNEERIYEEITIGDDTDAESNL